jgi:RimJ/RimL family protein N-acetyltransferase
MFASRKGDEPMTEIKEYGSVRIGHATFTLRDLEIRDIEAIVSYWHDSPTEYLESVGADTSKVKTREDTARAFRQSIKGVRERFGRATLIVSQGERVIGYTNINYKADAVAYAHVHLIAPELRGTGLAAQLFRLAVSVFLTEFPTRELRFQANTKNQRVNRYLQKMGLTPCKTEYLDDPDGMARAGTFNLYILDPTQFSETQKAP